MTRTTTRDRPELKPVNVGAAAIDFGSTQERAWAQNKCKRCRMALPASFLWSVTRELPS